MAVLQHVVAPEGVAAGRGYSQVVTGQGRLVVVSGQIAQDERGELVGPGDPAAQARRERARGRDRTTPEALPNCCCSSGCCRAWRWSRWR